MFLIVLSTARARAADVGAISGAVIRAGDEGALSGVTVVLNELGRVAVTGADGGFEFARVAAGTYSLRCILGPNETTESAVKVAGGRTTELEIEVPWSVGFAESLTVTSASRRRERIVSAPASVTTVLEDEMILRAAAGQVPKLLDATVGVEAPQSGLYDINLNTRGFNGHLTRRIQTIIDGRDVSVPATAGQDWWTIAQAMEELDSIELTRGPSAALYGPNSFNGVLSLTTRSPRDSQGARLRLTGGDLDTFMGSARWAGPLGDAGWFLRASANHTRSEGFSRDRSKEVEYAGLDLEPVAPQRDDLQHTSGTIRLDNYRSNGDVMVMEGGLSVGDGEVYVTAAGRGQQEEIRHGWARFNYNAPKWNLGVAFNRREAESVLLSAGASLFDNGQSVSIDLQGNHTLDGDRTRFVGGAQYTRRDLDSLDGNGNQTLYADSVDSDHAGLFGQVDHKLTDQLKVVLAARFDESTLHEAQFSPKAYLVYEVTPLHSLRAGYNRAFQVATYTELYLDLVAGPPLDLSALEGAFAPVLGETSLGLGAVPLLAHGNPDLDVEKVQSLEVGYRGIIGQKLLVNLGYYHNWTKDFISGLLPGGNPAVAPYQAPSELPDELRSVIEQTVNENVPGMTNLADGSPAFVLSYGNSGEVTSQGVELELTYFVHDHLRAFLNYAWLDFEIQKQNPGAEIHLNAPENRFGLGATYIGEPLSATISWRWVDAFDWASGVFVGPVPAYDVVDVSAQYRVQQHAEVGVSISNLLDDVHYEAFGGDLLSRRALAWLSLSW